MEDVYISVKFKSCILFLILVLNPMCLGGEKEERGLLSGNIYYT